MAAPRSVSVADRALRGVADLIKLLPSGTVFLFQFLTPLVTNNGHCTVFNKVLSGALVALCGAFCAFSSFTDSYVGSDGRVYYGVVTRRGIRTFASDPDAASRDLSAYRLRAADFVHAGLSLLVFATIALLDTDTVSCLYPALEVSERTMMAVLPPVVGGVAGYVFMMFPNNRHGIGYQPARATEDFEHKYEPNQA
ncbi:protein DMP2-like [Phragmites australis]|uniref:protein DMP2-like n=1 Tax=Phragmites australis TaxID=29695 RepID=UPI002D7905B8|nr:protein DMP2-like [Phragmites australis]